MSDEIEDAAVLAAVVNRLNLHRLPRLIDLKAKVDRGEAINGNDQIFLERVLADARRLHPMVERNPEVQPLYAQVTKIYSEILDEAVNNESDRDA